MAGWSLGRAAGERAAASAKGNNAAAPTDSPARRPFRATSAANRARPSSMISLDFPSSEVVAETKVSEDDLVATAVQPDKSPAPASAALHMLAAAQQRDKAHRQRTASTGSAHSGTSDHKRARKSSASTATTTTSNSPLPSLIKTHAARSPVAALSATSTLASPSLDRKAAREGRASLTATSSSEGRNEAQGLAAGPASHTKALSTATNTLVSTSVTADDAASISSFKRRSKAKASKTAPDSSIDSAVDSLLRLQNKENMPASPTTSKITTAPSHEPVLPNDAPVGEAEQSTLSNYPYELRKVSRRHAHHSFEAASQRPAPARYEVALVVNRSLAPFAFSTPQTSRRRQLGLISVPVPSRLACDRLAQWTVERGARIAACVVNLLGS